jgi:hypothetical protein
MNLKKEKGQNPKSSYITVMEPVSIRSYQALLDSTKEPLLYSAPWWLDATCGAGGWDVLVSYNNDRTPVAALPYQRSRIRGLSAITTPPLTQWVSLLPVKGNTDQPGQVNLSSLPKASILDLTLRPDDRINLQEASFSPSLKYSFIIPRTTDFGQVRSGYNEGLRRNLRQAEKLHAVEESDNLAGFLNLCHQTYHDRHMKPPPWFDQVIPEVYTQLIARQCGSLTLAYAQGKIIAGVLIAWDQHTSYYLAGGKVADDHGTAAHALLLDHAIRDACVRGTDFDFEGSMHPGIANFFQSFGAVPVSYWHFRKYSGAGRLWSVLKK